MEVIPALASPKYSRSSSSVTGIGKRLTYNVQGCRGGRRLVGVRTPVLLSFPRFVGERACSVSCPAGFVSPSADGLGLGADGGGGIFAATLGDVGDAGTLSAVSFPPPLSLLLSFSFSFFPFFFLGFFSGAGLAAGLSVPAAGAPFTLGEAVPETCSFSCSLCGGTGEEPAVLDAFATPGVPGAGDIGRREGGAAGVCALGSVEVTDPGVWTWSLAVGVALRRYA